MNAELNAISPMAAYVASFTQMQLPAWVMILVATAIHWFLLLLPPITLMGFLDRKLGADIQMRIGPNRVSFFGLFQVIADAIKSIFKEDVGAEAQEGWLFRWGAVAAIVCVFVSIGNIPMSESWALANLDSGAPMVIAALAFSNLCLFWAAYSVQSQWSVVSAFRMLSMVASYVVPVGIALLAPILIAGSPNFEAIVRAQGGLPWKWFVFHNPGTLLSCAGMFLGLQLWQGRAPFDHYRTRGEVAGGLISEYSGLRRGLMEFLDYASLFLASGFIVTVYLGGWQTPFNLESFGRAANIVQWLVFMIKIHSLVLVSIWIRWSLPSLRIDQIISLSWRVLAPLGLLGSALTAVWLVAFHGKGLGDFL